MILVAAAVYLGVAAFALLLFAHWITAAALVTAWFVSSFAAALLIRRADPEALDRRSGRLERRLVAWGRALGRLSGGWNGAPRA